MCPATADVTLEIPAQATNEPIHAETRALDQTELQSFGQINGFLVFGGFELTLQRIGEQSVDIDGDGQPDPPAPVELLKAARATVTVETQLMGDRILVEVLDDTPYGRLSVSPLASRLSPLPPYASPPSPKTPPFSHSTAIQRGPLSDSPVHPAHRVRHRNAPALIGNNRIHARITSLTPDPGPPTPLGVTDLTRSTGLFAFPVASQPAGPFQLVPR